MKKEADSRKESEGWFNVRDIESYARRFSIFLTKSENENPFKPPIMQKKERPKKTKSQNLLHWMKTYEAESLAFLKDPSIPFTNNLVEQDVRMMKVQQKVSGCFRTISRTQMFARNRPYLSTLRNNNQDVMDCIRSAISGYAFCPSCPEQLPETFVFRGEEFLLCNAML